MNCRNCDELKLEVATLIKTATKFQQDSEMYQKLFWDEAKKNHWNLVSEGLPEDSENVLIQTTSTKYPIRTASLRKSIDRNLYWCDGFGNEIIPITKGIIKVIAWMPLPEPYCTR